MRLQRSLPAFTVKNIEVNPSINKSHKPDRRFPRVKQMKDNQKTVVRLTNFGNLSTKTSAQKTKQKTKQKIKKAILQNTQKVEALIDRYKKAPANSNFNFELG